MYIIIGDLLNLNANRPCTSLAGFINSNYKVNYCYPIHSGEMPL